MIEKYKLKLAVGFLILLITIWLIRLYLFLNIDIIIGQLLLPFAIVLILRTLWSREKKPAKLSKFFIKSFVVSAVAVFIEYYIWRGTLFAIVPILGTLWLIEKKPAIEKKQGSKFLGFFIKSLIVSFLAVFAGYYWWWWPFYVEPYLPEFSYSAPGAGIAFILFLLLPLAFLIAGILTIVYVILKKQKIKTQ